MSIISDVLTDFSKISDYLVRYEDEIAAAEPIFDIEGKKLEAVNRTLPSYISRYDQLLGELKTLEQFLEVRRDEIEAKHWKKYNEKYSKALSTRDIQAYIAGEKDHIEMSELILEVRFVKEKISSIVKALEQMGWSLKNIVELRIHQLQDEIL